MMITLVVLLLVTTSLVWAAPGHSVQYLRIGQTADGQPVYVAFIQLNYMSAALAADIFGGQVISGQNTMAYGAFNGQGYDANRTGVGARRVNRY